VSQLQYIRSEAFAESPLNEVVISASVVEIDPSAFFAVVWQDYVISEGRSIFWIDNYFILQLHSRRILRSISLRTQLLVGLNIEVIAANAFRQSEVSPVLFESSTKLRFRSSESLKRVFYDRSLDNGLNKLDVNVSSSMFRIEVEDG
jgi:hypothetical protein